MTIANDSQVASSLDTLKMSDSPVKKLDFNAGKENQPHTAEEPVSTVVDTKKIEQAPVEAESGLKPEEMDEPLLQANPNRFVLFPIKYHEVRNSSTSTSPRQQLARLHA
jgi:ribonucleoside-diphosphate reductase subunit M2